MTSKKDFTEEEWTHLLQAPMAAGIYIMVTDPSFIVGSLKEGIAVASGIFQKAKEANSELLTALLEDLQQKEVVKKAQVKFETKDIDTIKKKVSGSLQDAAQILDKKAAGEECEEIKNWLYDIGVKVAEAAKEGGFLGFGGTRVSEAEAAALQEISGYLGINVQ